MTRIDTAAAFQSAFGVSRETIAKLTAYEQLLRQWQKAVNLVAPATLDEVWHRHFADSAQLAALVPAGGTHLVDLGSGAGFPGLVLAIIFAEMASKPTVTLVESDTRKAAFLRDVARVVAVPVDILVARIENPETQLKLATADVVTARALAPLPRLLDWLAPSIRPECTALLLKGREVEADVAEAATRFSFSRRLVPSRTQTEARIVILTALGQKPED